MKELKLEVESRTVVRVLLIVTGFVIGLLILRKIAVGLELVGIAFFLAMALNPTVSAMARHFPINPQRGRILATGVSYLVVVIILGGLLFSIVPTIFRQTTAFIETVPVFIQDVQDSNGTIGHLISKYHLEQEINRNIGQLQNNTASIASDLVGGVSKITDSIVKIATVLVMTFLMLVEGPRWQKYYWRFYKDDKLRARHRELGHRMYKVITGYVNGQVIIAAIAGAMTLIVILVLSLFFTNLSSSIALPLAGIIFVTALIPMVGSLIGATLVTLLLLLYSIPAALIFLAYFIIHQQFENYVIHPMIQSHTINLSPLGVFVAAILGFYLLGPIGGFVAIPIAGCLHVLVVDYVGRHNVLRSAKDVEEATVE
ncbi:MAG TPA: AI-2E family transporter [Candidatus Saccharimonadales bacterium]|nr:AI-2E family transporter [Candidatus Saccharimonadales bacterium]